MSKLHTAENAPPFVNGRLLRLPLWAQIMFSNMRAREINDDLASCLNADVRRTAKQVLGGNCTFSDDDLRLLAGLAVRAIDAGLHKDLAPDVVANIEKAKAAREAEQLSEMVD